MIELVCVKPFPFAGRKLREGERFHVEQKFLRVLTVSGMARLASDEPDAKPKRKKHEPRD